jgi:hypothetical protein
MGTNKNIMYVIAFFLGLLIFHFIKGNSGCNNVIEGQGQDLYQADLIRRNDSCPEAATVDGDQLLVVKIESDDIFNDPLPGEKLPKAVNSASDKTCENISPIKTDVGIGDGSLGSAGHKCKKYKQQIQTNRDSSNPYYKQCSINPDYVGIANAQLNTEGGPCMTLSTTNQCMTHHDCTGTGLATGALCEGISKQDGCNFYQTIGTDGTSTQCADPGTAEDTQCIPLSSTCIPPTITSSGKSLDFNEMQFVLAGLDDSLDTLPVGCC